MNTTITDIGKFRTDLPAAQGESFLKVGELSTYGVEWEDCSRATSMGGMAYFGHFLQENGLFDDLVNGCPLTYASNNAPSKRRVLGTVVSGILNGAWRYAHLSHKQGDSLCAETLGIKGGFVSEDSVRRGFKKGAREDWDAWDAWLREAELASILPLLGEPYVLDVDTSVKPVYGHQEGAEIGYNPQKPGRPSQSLHVAFVGRLRLLAAVDVCGGKAHAACHMSARVWAWVDALEPGYRPRLIRGDIGFGNEGYLSACEARDLPYLFKLKASPKVKKLIRQMASMPRVQWSPAPGGWDVTETSLQLTGWSRERRIVLLRRPLPERKPERSKEPGWLPGLAEGGAAPEWEYVTLVCSGDIPAEALPVLYAERADCENVLDELKNQWGMGGFTTKDLKRCKVMARLNALICNWWNVFARIAEPSEHMEALTSRPELLYLVATLATHGGRKVLRFCSHHENACGVRRAFTRLHTVFSRIDSIARQLGRRTVWTLHLSVAFYAFLQGKVLKVPPEAEKIIRELSAHIVPATS